MNKLEAWTRWLEITNSSDGEDEVSLDRSSHGKTFSFAWDAALDQALAEMALAESKLKTFVSVRRIDKILDSHVVNLDLDRRTFNCLRSEGIEKVGELVRYSESQLLNVPNFGRRCLNNITDALSRYNLKLAMLPLTVNPSAPFPRHQIPKIKKPKVMTGKKPRVNKRQTVATIRAARRREFIYAQYQKKEMTVAALAESFNITPARVHQIVQRVEQDRAKLNAQIPSIESIKAHAMRQPIPPWLREDQLNEPSND